MTDVGKSEGKAKKTWSVLSQGTIVYFGCWGGRAGAKAMADELDIERAGEDEADQSTSDRLSSLGILTT